MKNIQLIFVLIFLLQSCTQHESESVSDITIEDQWSTIKKTTDLRTYEIFLIEHPDPKLLPEIIDSIRVAWDILLSEAPLGYIPYCRGHCFYLLINQKGDLLFDSELIDNKDLVFTIKKALLFPEKFGRFSIEETLGRKEVGPPYPIRGIIEIRGDEDLSPTRYAEVIELVKQAYIAVRKDYAKTIFQKNYEDLNKIENDSIQKMVPFRIGFEKTVPPPPPPPPIEPEE